MNYPVQSITQGPKHHFFGYYDMRPWDATGQYHLVLEVDFMDRPPAADDSATVGMVDLKDGNRLIPLTRTRAWNFQQGSMLHWHERRRRTILFNDRRDGRFVCVACDIDSGHTEVLGPATADVSDDGKWAATLNFARIADTRPGYGYAGLVDPFFNDNAPGDDGLGLLNLLTGEHRLLLSFADVQRLIRASGGVDYGPGKMYFNHVLINPSATGMSLIVRWLMPDSWWKTQLWTVPLDGSPAFCRLVGPMVSHYDWKDDRTLIAWAGVDGVEAMYEFDAWNRDKPKAVFTDTIVRDGHVCYSRNRKFVACDTYPDAKGNRELFLIDCATGRRMELGSFYSPMAGRPVEIRCDFHPSFSADDRQLAFDGVHESGRQRYVLDLP